MRSLARWWMIAVALLAGAVLLPAYWIALHAPAAGMFHDDGVYLVTAKALATGHGYRIISLPDEIPQTKYPILFPFVLSLVWRLAPEFPSNVLALKLVPLFCGLVWFWLCFRFIARESSRGVAAICVALIAAMLWSVYLSTALLSETMFAALCMGSLYYLRGEEIRGEAGREWIAAAVLAGLACLTRTAGVCAIATGAVYFLAHRRVGRAVKFLAVALVVCGPWFLWTMSQHLPDTDAYYSAANYGSWNVLSRFFSFDQKAAILALNALMLLRSPLAIAGVRWNGWLEVLSSVVFLVAALRWLRRTVMDIFLVIYAALVMAWAWPPERFVVVIYPLILLLIWRVCRAIPEKFPRLASAAQIAGVAVVLVVLAQSLWSVMDSVQQVSGVGVMPVMGPQDSWTETSQEVNWIRDQTPPDSIVLANVDPVFYLYAGRKAVRGFQADPYRLFYMPQADGQPLGTVTELRTTIRKERVRYIVRAPNRIFAEAPYLDRLILELVRSEPDAFRLVFQGGDARFQIYRVERPI